MSINHHTLGATCLCLALLITGCGNSEKDTHPQQWVSKRQALFKRLTKTLEPMGLVARDRADYVAAEFKDNAHALQALSTQPWALFPTDSNYPPTRAKAEVWSRAADFKQAQQRYLDAVDGLVKVSGSADMPAIRLAVDNVQKACKSCHDAFRSDR